VGSIDGVSYYQVGSGPNGLLVCGDVWGWNGGRIRALADDWAKKGLSVWVPKALPAFEGGTDGDGLPPAFNIHDRGAELGPLLGGDWGVETVMPKFKAVIKAMKTAGVKKMGFVGVCYGAWVGMHLSKEVSFVGCASPHPSIHIESMLGKDPVALAAATKCPWALFPAGKADDGGDSHMYDSDGTLIQALEEKFPGMNVSKRFPNVPHGFVTRGSIKEHAAASGADVTKAVEECVAEINDFFAKRGLLCHAGKESAASEISMSCCPSGAAGYLAADHADEGSVGSIDGVSYYQVGSGPNGLLVCGDVWGWNGGRIRALADDWAKKGLSVWVPKALPAFEGGTDGDGLPPAFNIHDRGAELGPLLGGDWGVETVMPKFKAVIKAMKTAGVKKMGFVGVCYGAWVGMHLSKEVSFVGCASPHPSIHIESMLGKDPVALAAATKCPWALFPAGKADDGGDSHMYDSDGTLIQALEEKFPGMNVSKRFPNVPHGFVTRGSIKEHAAASGADVTKAVEECVAEINDFFAKRGLLRHEGVDEEAGGLSQVPAIESKVTSLCCWPLQLTPRIWSAARPAMSSQLPAVRTAPPSE